MNQDMKINVQDLDKEWILLHTIYDGAIGRKAGSEKVRTIYRNS